MILILEIRDKCFVKPTFACSGVSTQFDVTKPFATSVCESNTVVKSYTSSGGNLWIDAIGITKSPSLILYLRLNSSRDISPIILPP